MSSSDREKGSLLDKRIEEAWLLWKLKRKKEAREVIVPLLSQHPGNRDLVYLGALTYLETGNLRQAKVLAERLESMVGEEKRVKELKARISLQEGKWNEALKAFDELINVYPKEWDYRLARAEILSRLKRWTAAKEAYSELMSDDKRRQEIIWDYREANKEGSWALNSEFEYFHGPESLRWYRIVEDMTVWVHRSIRATMGVFEEIYRKRALGETQAVEDAVPGHSLKGEWFLNGLATVSGEWQTAYHAGYLFHEAGGEVRIDRPNFNSTIGYSHNHFVRDPVEGLEKKARLHRLRAVNNIILFDRLTVGHQCGAEWYRVKSKENQVNGKESLGHKLISDAFLNLTILKKPHLSCNVHHRYAHWDKSFEAAQDVLDFVEDERMYYGGVYAEEKIGTLAQISASLTRSYDHKREFYSSIATFEIDLWFREDIQAHLSYEFDHNAQGTYGTGDVQLMTAKLTILF